MKTSETCAPKPAVADGSTLWSLRSLSCSPLNAKAVIQSAEGHGIPI
jgi:hypothetical protein